MKGLRQRLQYIRRKLGIPLDGFENEEQSLDWYRRHYEKAKGEPFIGTFGFRFDPSDKTKLLLDSSWDPFARRFSINDIPPIDKRVPFDQEVLKLGANARIGLSLMPALRLVVLVRSQLDSLPDIVDYMFVPLGAFHSIVQPPGPLSKDNQKRLLKDANHPDEFIRTEFNKELYQKHSPFQQTRAGERTIDDVGGLTPRWINAMEVKKVVVGYLVKKGYIISTDDDDVTALDFQSSTTSIEVKDSQVIEYKFNAIKNNEKIFIYTIGRPSDGSIANYAYNQQFNKLLAQIMYVQSEKRNVSFVFALPKEYKQCFIDMKRKVSRNRFKTPDGRPVDFGIYFVDINAGIVEERRWREFYD